jgi:hypothetical protein
LRLIFAAAVVGAAEVAGDAGLAVVCTGVLAAALGAALVAGVAEPPPQPVRAAAQAKATMRTNVRAAV